MNENITALPFRLPLRYTNTAAFEIRDWNYQPVCRIYYTDTTSNADAKGAYIAEACNAYPALTARVKELEEACLKTTASLLAAISLLEGGGNRAAWSDKVFYQMIRDYKAAAEKGRSALNKEPT